MEQWDPRKFDFDNLRRGEYTFIYGKIEPETTYEVTITLKTDHIDDKTAVERFVACTLIGMMPEKGLEEALSSLWDMLQFYSKPLALAAPKSKTEIISATITDKKKRPDLIITA